MLLKSISIELSATSSSFKSQHCRPNRNSCSTHAKLAGNRYLKKRQKHIKPKILNYAEKSPQKNTVWKKNQKMLFLHHNVFSGKKLVFYLCSNRVYFWGYSFCSTTIFFLSRARAITQLRCAWKKCISLGKKAYTRLMLSMYTHTLSTSGINQSKPKKEYCYFSLHKKHCSYWLRVKAYKHLQPFYICIL